MPPLTYIHGLMRTDAVGGSRGEAMPNRWNSESHQACLDGRVVTEVGVANRSCFDRRSNNVNEAKIMGGKFGRSNIFATHSLHLLNNKERATAPARGRRERIKGTGRVILSRKNHGPVPLIRALRRG